MSFSVAAAARACPEVVALDDGRAPLTFAELAVAVDRTSAELGLDVARSPVAFIAEPTLEACVTLLAAVERGVPALPLSRRATEGERAQLVAAAGARVVDPPSLGARARLVGASAPRAEPIPDDPRPLALVATSGSAGEPKLAVLSRAAFAAATDASAERLGWVDGDRWLLALSCAHVGGLSVLLRCLRARKTVVLAGPHEALADALLRGRATIASLVPAQLAGLVDARLRPAPWLRLVLVGGAAAPSSLVARARSLGWPVVTSWGMTETCAQIATEDPRSLPVGEPGCGRPLRAYEVRSREGLLEVRGPSLLTGYLESGDVRSPLLEGGWLATNDLGFLDAQGCVHVVGRADEAIVTGGEKVAPSRVEAALSGVPGVEQVCVFGVPDPRWGAIVAAAVVPLAGEVPRLGDGLACLAPHERPRLWAPVPALALTASGKVDRRGTAARAMRRLRPIAP